VPWLPEELAVFVPERDYPNGRISMTRLRAEQLFHDEQAARRRPALARAELRFADDAYLDHESWVRPAMKQLGDVRGRRVLDLGCGHGMAAVVLARGGALVTGLELSGGYLAEAKARAEANGAAIAWVQGDAENLPFADRSFDAIWGHAILHHLDLARAAAEVERVLRPGGRAVFCEPWGGNPVLRWARRRLSYRGKEHTPDELPLRASGLSILQQRFPQLEWQGYQLLGMVRRIYGANLLTRGLTALDGLCLRGIGPLRHWCRYVVLTLPRNA
jgi:SAM-dependent methyltransferase